MSDRDADGCRDADASVEFVKGARIPQIRRLPDEVDFAEQCPSRISKGFRQGGCEMGPATTPTAGQSLAIRMSMAASF